tara:strand:+ start:2163 stop:2891 length:729 start_codon:yes stop_codon:yes gene_type:complete
MAKIRIIPRLDIKNSNLIKTINLDGLKVIGNPNKFAIDYYKKGADELLFMDSVASLYGRNNIAEIITGLSKDIFIPITVGGGIRSIKDALAMFKSGADKISINTAAIENPKLIKELSKEFGSQSLVISIEAKKIGKAKWVAFKHNGRDNTNLDVVEWAKKATDNGAGEILITSIDNEGLNTGLDFDLFKEILIKIKIPIILGGGFRSLKDATTAKKLKVDAIAISGALHYKKINIKDIKKKL